MNRNLLGASACSVVAELRSGSLDPEMLVRSALARIDQLDGKLNAVPTRLNQRALDACVRIRDERATAVADERWMGGIPILIKDTHPIAGVRTTYGSKVFADHVPDESSWHVDRLERMGAIVIGKSNTPEFAAGAQTFNEVHGATRNPWNLSLTCGGSSGGSAVGVATGMAWLADGSDLGGSLRIPAAFCNVVGLRPSIGRVAHGPQRTPFQTLNVVGPIAREVRDVALMLDALSGPDSRDPLSLSLPPERFVVGVDGDPDVNCIGFDADLGGRLRIDSDVAMVLQSALDRLRTFRVNWHPVSVATDDAIGSFQTLRAQYLAGELSAIHTSNPGVLKSELAKNIDEGIALTGARVAAAEQARGELLEQMMRLLSIYPIIALPTAVMPPFDLTMRFPREFGGNKFESYFDWAAPTFVISLTGCPALSLPCGFTPHGLPVGIQLVARPRHEAQLLAFAAKFERALGVAPWPSI